MLEEKVSIIMPVYNSEKYLTQTIESILAQTYENFELILVDDGSSDKSGKICDEFGQKDNRIKVIHKENGGICDARNSGLDAATGQYIMFSDNDDTMEKNAIYDNINIMIENKADIVKFGRKAIYIDDNNIELKTDIRKFEFEIIENINENFIKLMYDKVLVCVWDGIYKKSIVEKFDTEFKKGGEDIDFNFKVFTNANKIILNNNVSYNHYIRNGFSTSTKYNEDKIANTFKLMNEFKNYTNLTSSKYAEMYNLILIRDYVNAILLNCNNLEKDDIYIYFKKIEKEFKIAKKIRMFKLSKKYTIEYILMKLKFYKILIILSHLKMK